MDREDPLAAAARLFQAEAAAMAEQLRTKRLHNLDLIDLVLDERFRDVVMVAALTCGVPMAQINLLDATHQYIKARYGADGPLVSERSSSICDITVSTPDRLTEIPDCSKEPRLCNNPWVTSGAVKFYAGAPLLGDDGRALGTLCVFDGAEPHTLTLAQRDSLLALARMVSTMLLAPKIA